MFTIPSLDILELCCEDPLQIEQSEYDTEEFDGVSSFKRNKAKIYATTFVCLILLERWLELGIRPSDKAYFNKAVQISYMDEDVHQKVASLWKNEIDNLSLLKELVNSTRRALWKAAMEPLSDDHLIVKPSRIPGASMGLFAAKDLPVGTICCYYYGDIHSIQSSQSHLMLRDASYLLRIGTIDTKPWWYDLLKCDAEDTDTGNINDISAVYDWLRKEWSQVVGAQSTGAEFFVDPTNSNIKARYINDCLQDSKYNVKYVLDPKRERAAVVTVRSIRSGEELYVSYGQPYWDSLEAMTGIVPKPLPDGPREDTNRE